LLHLRRDLLSSCVGQQSFQLVVFGQIKIKSCSGEFPQPLERLGFMASLASIDATVNM
jgi:hypothetical protein